MSIEYDQPAVSFDDPDATEFHVVCPYCGEELEIYLEPDVQGTLVMDCNALLLKLTEAMAELAVSAGLRASQRLLYQRPDRRTLGDWMRIYNFRAGPQLKP